MKKTLFILLYLLPILTFGQYKNSIVSQMKLQFIIADEFIGEDSYGFQYFIKNNTFFKYKNNETWQYKSISLGKIAKVDIKNPLRIILFYENFNTIVALDNQLNEIQKLNFSEITPDIVVSKTGMSINDNLWIFNSLNQQLGLYNYAKNTYQSIGLPFNKKVKKYETSLNEFYWIDEENQFYKCDIFGKITLISKIADYDVVFIESGKTILYQKNESLFLLDLNKNKTIPLEDIEKTFKSFFYKDQNLAIFTTKGIINYKINLP
jgi:hypothetical protein